MFKDYILEKDKIFYGPNENGISALPDSGTYFLTPTSQSDIFFSVGPVSIKIDKPQLNIDTLQATDLSQVIIMHSKNLNANKYENWEFCGQPANGKLVDYTLTGRTEGEFRKGRAIGKIKSYNKTGDLTFIAYYNGKGKHLRNKRTKAYYKHSALRDLQSRSPIP